MHQRIYNMLGILHTSCTTRNPDFWLLNFKIRIPSLLNFQIRIPHSDPDVLTWCQVTIHMFEQEYACIYDRPTRSDLHLNGQIESQAPTDRQRGRTGTYKYTNRQASTSIHTHTNTCSESIRPSYQTGPDRIFF